MTKHSRNLLGRRTVLAGLVAAPAAIIWGLAESGRLSTCIGSGRFAGIWCHQGRDRGVLGLRRK